VEEEYNFENTSQVKIPSNMLEQIIGQDEAVRIAKLVATQKRHLLLVGAPGTGKSMIARSIASLLPSAKTEISVLHNPAKPERPFLEIRDKNNLKDLEMTGQQIRGIILMPDEVPHFVSERLGFRCRACAKYSSPNKSVCPYCNKEKFRQSAGPFDDLLVQLGDNEREDVVHTTKISDGKEELVIFERVDERTIRALNQDELAQGQDGASKGFSRNVIVPIDRKLFVQATGASETELLGDVRHDPYGGHNQIGTPAYTRVVPGAIHEAHEGVLFIDELISIGHLQRHILTAMQDKRFPIMGRNSSSTGATVKVDAVPCDFILVSAINLSDIHKIMPALRSRISGDGYEVVVNSVMDDTVQNRLKFAQFVAQEIKKDTKIPHASQKAVLALLNIARKKARILDQRAGISLRLRSLSGILKSAGDWAVLEGSPLIEQKHVDMALKHGKMAEEQMSAKYGSIFKASMSDWEADFSNPNDKDAR